MAVVVIGLMFVFVGGVAFQGLMNRRPTGLNKPIAYYGDHRKITSKNLSVARRELDILRALKADVLLHNQELRGILLGEILFTEQSAAPEVMNLIKQMVRNYQYRISDKQINDMYRRTVPSSIYWMLLKAETKSAGIMVSNEQAGQVLGQMLPQVYNGMKYSQVINNLMNQYGLPEEQILRIFGQLLATLQYSRFICSNEDITISQISQTVAFERETINAELVQFESSVFTSNTEKPSPAEEKKHFDKYKKFAPSEISDENPYGFGYKLPDRVQLEYIVVKLDDVEPLIKSPTNQEKEDYYNRYRLSPTMGFTEQVRSDPNDPNSPMIDHTKSYSEVIDVITKQLVKNKVNSTASRILQEAKKLTDLNIENIEADLSKMTNEQLKEAAGDYKTAAEKLTKKHNIKIYQGQTGLLSPEDFQQNEYFTRLYVDGQGQMPVPLIQIVFAAADLTASELGPLDVAKPEMYKNIGPLKDYLSAPRASLMDTSGQIMALVRIIKTEKAAEPQSIDLTYSTKSPSFDPYKQDEETLFSVREKVTEDLKKLAAMKIAKNKAQEFIAAAKKDGWDGTIDKFNKTYGKKTNSAENSGQDLTKPFKLQNRPAMRRISETTIQTMTAHSIGNPMAQQFLNGRRKQQRFVDKLYSLVPQNRTSAPVLPLIMEFKPDLSYYCVKNLSIQRINLEDYQRIKGMLLQREDYVQSESMVAVHFNPENILKRMKFERVETDESEDKEKETTEEAEESS
jgi:hypothetical protein